MPWLSWVWSNGKPVQYPVEARLRGPVFELLEDHGTTTSRIGYGGFSSSQS